MEHVTQWWTRHFGQMKKEQSVQERFQKEAMDLAIHGHHQQAGLFLLENGHPGLAEKFLEKTGHPKIREAKNQRKGIEQSARFKAAIEQNTIEGDVWKDICQRFIKAGRIDEAEKIIKSHGAGHDLWEHVEWARKLMEIAKQE